MICDECGTESEERAWGWEAHLSIDNAGYESVALFCPDCLDALCE